MGDKKIITTRAVTDADKAVCAWVEAGAITGNHYAMDVWEQFTSRGDGEMTAALCEGILGGMGKLTRLYGAYAWLELLRVHPDYQRMGLGKAIYRRYMEQMAEMKLEAAGMYTGLGNHASRGLAEMFGLSIRGEFCELIAPPELRAGAGDFEPVAAHLAEAASEPFYDDMGNFIVINRTFYPVQRGLGELLGRMGWLYKRGEDIAIAGFRFQPEKAIHLAYVSGDVSRATALASFLARQHGSAVISANRCTDNVSAADSLRRMGFMMQPTKLVTLWVGL